MKGAALFIGLTLCARLACADVVLNFVNADIDQVARAIGAAANQTIIVDPRVRGQLNLVSERPVPPAQALKTLEASLRMQGFALLEDHGVLKVVPEADAKHQGVPTYLGNAPRARGDQVVTQVFQLRNESANNLLPVLRPLISPNNAIAAYPGNNTLVVTDYADNVRRIASIIAGVDNAAAQQVEVVGLQNANALDVAAIAQKQLDPGIIGNSDATLRVGVSADVRTNSVILRAGNPQRMKMARALVARLDAPTREPGNIHVVPLRNADATSLAKTLRAMLGQGNASSGSGSSGTSASSAGTALSGSGTGSTNGSGSAGVPLPSGTLGTFGSGMSGTSSGAGTGSGDAFGSSRGLNSSNSNEGEESGGGMVQADAATNSLIITAPDAMYRNLRNVIEQLDARRVQVYIESLIAEVTTTNAGQFGIQWQGGASSSNGNNILYGNSNFSSATSTGIVNLTAAGLAATGTSNTVLDTLASGASVQNGLNIGLLHRFGSILGVGGLLQAMASNGDVNVLSTPSLITLDNQEARILVGQNVPLVSGSYSTPATGSTSSTLSAFNTFSRQDVGLMLHVRPQISQNGTIKLAIYQEDSSLVNGTGNQAGGYTINKRAVQSTVLCDDGSIIALGGLLRDNYANDNSKVPFLGDLPVLGRLFRSESKSRTKSNLMVFLRPVIVRDADTAQQISLDRYDYMRAQSAAYRSDNRSMLDRDVPQMPPPLPSPAQGGGAGVGAFDPPTLTPRAQPAPAVGAPSTPPAETPRP